MKLKYLFSLCFICFGQLFAQNKIDIDAKIIAANHTLVINQTIEYYNNSNDTLTALYLLDWNHSFSSKDTPLGKRFEEEFSDKFRFSNFKERGETIITKINSETNANLIFERLKNAVDVIKVNLNTPLLPNLSSKITLSYNLKLPSSKFTSYGVAADKNYNLKYWYLAPAVYNGNWQYYSNKNLDDFYTPLANVTIKITHPEDYKIISQLNEVSHTKGVTVLEGKNRLDTKLFIQKSSKFKTFKANNIDVVSDFNDDKISLEAKDSIVKKVINFITTKIGNYPHKKLMVSAIDAKKNPLYGLNQLPSFIRPFPKNFQYEIHFFKTTLSNYLNEILHINPRKSQWIIDGLLVYFVMDYVESYYPNVKLIGKLANIWGIKAFHISNLKFNDQYPLYYLNIARLNRDQPLGMDKDSLTKFNNNIANKYKAGLGFKYLDEYLEGDNFKQLLKQYVTAHALKPTKEIDFENYIKANTSKNVDWFFLEFVAQRKHIDYKIKQLRKTKDSVSFIIKNKTKSKTPIALFTLKRDSIVSKTWLDTITDEQKFKLARHNIDKIALNHDGAAAEFNLRNNHKQINRFLFFNKKPQLRLIKDAENPKFNQTFLTPEVEFNNIYDGFVIGSKFSNTTLLRKAINYKITPQYAFGSKTLIGGGSLTYTKFFSNTNLFSARFGASGSYASFGDNLFVTRLNPFINLRFRDPKNLRSNAFQALDIRLVDIKRDNDPLIDDAIESPNYSVFNLRYTDVKSDLIDLFNWSADLQLAKNFGKLSLKYIYRKRFQNNKIISLRLFGGTFLYNSTKNNSNFFNFALDRPTDYLFDFNYLGRSESGGIITQQIIIAEGGFKSKLKTAFANQWITTANLSATLWKDIQAYGDIGFVKSKGINSNFVYDSGLRVNLLTDYFELYFPVYSNNGFEIAQNNYHEKIRFVFTAQINALLSLFTRKWY